MLWRHALAFVVVGQLCACSAALAGPGLSDKRFVFQTDFGDIEMALYPDVAPVTTAHILKLVQLGGYNGNHFFRIDKGFVAQTASVVGGRQTPLDIKQQEEAEKTVPLEVQQDIKHNKRGILSMGRLEDPNSGGSSFSILLDSAPHLDMRYTIFGEVTAGFVTLTNLETADTVKEGIFVMPKERITITSTYVFSKSDVHNGCTAATDCQQKLAALQERFDAQSHRIEQARASKLP
ncbi:hypothetical protein ABBQ32_006386 [Trebouxia sp. C0010 RCD-2024]